MAHPSAFVSVVRSALRPGCAVCVSALFACAQPAREFTLSEAAQPILRGELDAEHPEVMLLFDRAGFMCTGTVIHATEQRGFLLTAAHCVTEQDDEAVVGPVPPNRLLVVVGEDPVQSTLAFAVEAVSVAPGYDGSFAADDVAVVRFALEGGEAPKAIAPLSSREDTLAVDDALLLVGYGQTEREEENALRRRVERRIEALDDLLIAYTQADGKGACFGDSGGPVLVQVGGRERVAAVISGGVSESDEECAGGFGVAMRVSAYEGFIEGVLASAPVD